MYIENISRQIKYNCDISDAKYWGYFSLCGLLLRLRELYKSEYNLYPWSKVDQQKIGEWITAKEVLWAKIEEEDFRNLEIDGLILHPFEVATINSLLIKHNLIYGAGFGLYKKPIFFFGELHSSYKKGDYVIYYVKKEFARDLFISSGMLQGKQIFVRLEQLLALLWEIFLELGCRKDNFFENIFSKAGITPACDITDEFTAKLESLALYYSELIVDHELAEAEEVDEEWREIILKSKDVKIEHFLRNLKDMIADTSDKGPLKKIIEKEDIGSLCFYQSYLEIFRKSLNPELSQALKRFKIHKNWRTLDIVRKDLYHRGVLLQSKVINYIRKGIDSEEFSCLLNSLKFYS